MAKPRGGIPTSTQVQVRFRGQFREQFRGLAPEGALELRIEPQSHDCRHPSPSASDKVRLQDLVTALTALATGQGETGALDQCAFFVDGRLLRRHDPIAEGSVVHVLSPIIGG